MTTATTQPTAAPFTAPPDKDIELAKLLQDHVESLSIEFEAYNALSGHDEGHMDERRIKWILRRDNELDESIELVKEQAKVMTAQLMSAKRALHWRWGAWLRDQIDTRLKAQKGKPKKSIDFLTGKAGYRLKASKVHIIDAKALTQWCSDNCPDALELQIARTTPIKEYIEANLDTETGELKAPLPDGCHYSMPRDEFFPSVDRSELPNIAYAPRHE